MLSIFHQLMKKSNILNILPAANNLLTCGGSMEKKNSHHLTYILQLLTKKNPVKKMKYFFYSSVKISSVKYGVANESVALIEYVRILTSQSVTVNLVQSGLILSKSHPFFGASLDFILTNVDNLMTWGVEIKYPSPKLDQSINDDVLKDKKFYLEKPNGKIQLNSRTNVLYPIQESQFSYLFWKKHILW